MAAQKFAERRQPRFPYYDIQYSTFDIQNSHDISSVVEPHRLSLFGDIADFAVVTGRRSSRGVLISYDNAFRPFSRVLWLGRFAK